MSATSGVVKTPSRIISPLAVSAPISPCHEAAIVTVISKNVENAALIIQEVQLKHQHNRFNTKRAKVRAVTYVELSGYYSGFSGHGNWHKNVSGSRSNFPPN
jgi:hypothetical protein